MSLKKMIFGGGLGGTQISPSLHRIYPSGPYSNDNVVVISRGVNASIGNNTDPEDFIKVAEYLERREAKAISNHQSDTF